LNITVYKPFPVFLLLVITGIIAYSGSFGVPFQFDDDPNIRENPLIQNPEIFRDSSSYCSQPEKAEDAVCRFFQSRYVGNLTFFVNYQLHGLHVAGYHAVNLLIHILSAFLVYLLGLLTFRTPFLRNSKTGATAGYIALFSALLFVSHPVQTQAVTYIVQRFASLATLFYLLSLVLYISARLAYPDTEHVTRSAEIQRWTKVDSKDSLLRPVVLYLLSIVSAVLAMKTKETAFTLPVMIVLYEFLFFNGATGKRILLLIPFLLTMFIIPLGFISPVSNAGELAAQMDETARLYTNLTRTEYFLTELRVIVTYIRLLLLPVNQNLDYDYPVFRSIADAEVLGSFFFLLAFIFIGVYLVYISRRGNAWKRVVGFGIFWFFVTLSVESGVIPIVDVIFEHRLYLPSSGFIFGLCTGLFGLAHEWQWKWQRLQKVVMAGLGLVTIIFAGATYARNIVWQDEISLWQDVVSKSPQKVRANYNLAHAYQDKKHFDRAIELYHKVVSLDQKYLTGYYNLANIYQSRGEFDKAADMYNKVIALDLKYFEAYNNMGDIFLEVGQYDKALAYLTHAISINPGSDRIYINRGRVYLAVRQYGPAIDDFNRALSVNLKNPRAYMYRAISYYSLNNKDAAMDDFRTSCGMGYKKACDEMKKHMTIQN
jgi:tetratricopeptide (TPR) repeat protein